MVLPVILGAQTYVESGAFQRNMNVGAIKTFTEFKTTLDSNYTAAKIETTKVYTGLAGFTEHHVMLASTDSASIVLQFQPYTGTAYLTARTIDSLSTTSNTGSWKSIDCDTIIGGFNEGRFILQFNSGATQGTSTGRQFSAHYTWRRF